MSMSKIWAVIALSIGMLATPAGADGQQRSTAGQPSSALGAPFRDGTVAVEGANIHYVVGGNGPPIVLIHGFPQDWTEFRRVMPRLSRRFTVLAVDLRGVGQSQAWGKTFDAATLASDIHQVVTKLGLKQPYIVGHDVGGQVAYAFALQYCDTIRGAMIAEIMLPGIKGTDALDASPFLWHVRFMQTPGVSEKLIAGRHDVFPGTFLNYGKFSADERQWALAAYRRDDQIEAMFQVYRAFPENAKLNASHRCASAVPIRYVTAEGSPFGEISVATLAGMKAAGLWNAQSLTVSGGSMHFLFADIPDAMADLIEKEAGPQVSSDK